MQYSLESVESQDYIFPDTENSQPEPIILKRKDLKDDIEFICPNNCANKIVF